MIHTNNEKLESRLWPYIQFSDHREYLTENADLIFEGLYLDFSEGRWRQQKIGYGLKAIDVQIEYDNLARIIESISIGTFL